MIEMIPGKLYKVLVSTLPVTMRWSPHDTKSDTDFLKLGKIFLFVETVEIKDKGTFSKILVDDRVWMTYNGYQLDNKVALVDNHERFSSTDRQINDKPTPQR